MELACRGSKVYTLLPEQNPYLPAGTRLACPCIKYATPYPQLIPNISTGYPQAGYLWGAPLGADGPCALTGSGIRLHSVLLYKPLNFFPKI